MNSGSAVSDQEEEDARSSVIIASPAGRIGEELHADIGDAEQREADPDAGAEQQEEDEEEDRDRGKFLPCSAYSAVALADDSRRRCCRGSSGRA